jgi:hypothetical protein
VEVSGRCAEPLSPHNIIKRKSRACFAIMVDWAFPFLTLIRRKKEKKERLIGLHI